MNFFRRIFSNPLLPNILTMGRLLAIPVVILSLAWADQERLLVAALTAAVYLVAALSDLLDGYLARKYHNESNLGRFLDPMADKLLVASAMIMMIPLGRIPAWVVFLIIARETMVTSLRAIAAEQGLVIAASAQGKQKTLAQNIAMFCLLWHHQLLLTNTQRVGSVILYVALAATYWSGALYFYNFLKAAGQKSRARAE
ncbi:MAG: CDP-diacylglycerol--glycerol-3-phosphate 3-phosphatidyltransferase [Deltaproteobacteria bacterium]|jgi:CDP-diacylglycerol--glycerol-3-phosphate 3-phosphatidyltransferase|nr:CDP-diacylglycerol--glycerol-3-phosphate 3-phosphatidyltransferase [Deltaproteobacteria bacterium]